MLLAGIWFSKEKPPMNVFLRPIIDEINEIYSKGNPFIILFLTDFISGGGRGPGRGGKGCFCPPLLAIDSPLALAVGSPYL